MYAPTPYTKKIPRSPSSKHIFWILSSLFPLNYFNRRLMQHKTIHHVSQLSHAVAYNPSDITATARSCKWGHRNPLPVRYHVSHFTNEARRDHLVRTSGRRGRSRPSSLTGHLDVRAAGIRTSRSLSIVVPVAVMVLNVWKALGASISKSSRVGWK